MADVESPDEQGGDLEVRPPEKTRQQLIDAIARELDIPAVERGSGSTVVVDFLDDVLTNFGVPAVAPSRQNGYTRIAAALERVGERYDPYLDSSEKARRGGNTVTNPGFAKLLSGIRRQLGTAAFIVNDADNEEGAVYADVPGESYGFADNVSGRLSLLAQDAGARLLIYRTSNAAEHPQHFVASATVERIDEAEPGRYRAFFADYRAFDTPVPADAVPIDGWNHQVSIVAVPDAFYRAVHAAGTGEAPPPGEGANPEGDDDEEPEVPVHTPVAGTPVPDGRPVHGASEPSAAGGQPVDVVEADVEVDDDPDPSEVKPSKRTRRSKDLDRDTERRAVEIALHYLHQDGWVLQQDRQRDGVGYDLLMGRGDDRLLVEVKGIRSDRLAFNLTAKEWALAKADPRFVVVAVTAALTDAFEVHYLRQPELYGAERTVELYRLRF